MHTAEGWESEGRNTTRELEEEEEEQFGSEQMKSMLKILLSTCSASPLSPNHSWIGLTTGMDLKAISRWFIYKRWKMTEWIMERAWV